MKRLVIIFAVLGIAGTVAAFRGGALPGPSGGGGGANGVAITPTTVQITTNGTEAAPALEMCSPDEGTGLFCAPPGVLSVTVATLESARFTTAGAVTPALTVANNGGTNAFCVASQMGCDGTSRGIRMGHDGSAAVIEAFQSGGAAADLTLMSSGVSIPDGNMTVGGLLTVNQVAANDTDFEVASFNRSRSDATAPGAGFGEHSSAYLEGSTNNSHVEVGSLGWKWEGAQTDDTAARDSTITLKNILNNAIQTVLTITSTGLATFIGGIVATTANFTGVLTSSSQITSTLNPADTTFANGSLIANPAACGSNEILFGGGVAGTGKAYCDCEGDCTAVQGTFSGAVAISGGVSNPSANTCNGSLAGSVCFLDATGTFATTTTAVTQQIQVWSTATTNNNAQIWEYGNGTGQATTLFATGSPASPVAVGGVGYYAASYADADYADKINVIGISKVVQLVRDDNVAAGSTLLEVRNNGVGTGVQEVVITGDGSINIAGAGVKTKGTATLSSGTVNVTTFTGAICVATDTAATPVTLRSQISGTTATFSEATGTSTHVINYLCF